MKHLYFLVEGETEEAFVNRLLIPYINQQLQSQFGEGAYIQALLITMKGGGHGFNNIEHFKNTIKPLLYNNVEPIITTMIDYFGLNSTQKIPNFEICILQVEIENRVKCMEDNLFEIVQSIKQGYRFFIPNIIMHEMETLLFANVEVGFDLEDKKIIDAVLNVCASYPSIEEINTTPEGAPSKRLAKIYKDNNKKYIKGADAIDIAELTGILAMLEKCPRFKLWIDSIIEAMHTYR